MATWICEQRWVGNGYRYSLIPNLPYEDDAIPLDFRLQRSTNELTSEKGIRDGRLSHRTLGSEMAQDCERWIKCT